MGSCCAKTTLPEQDNQGTVFAVPYGITIYQQGAVEPTDQPIFKQPLPNPTVRFSNYVTVVEWK
jgi:hypothetical protein